MTCLTRTNAVSRRLHHVTNICKRNSSDWFQRIGSPTFISAPMVGQSDLAFRALTRLHGSQLCFTQMIHAKNFVNDLTYRKNCTDWDDYTFTPSSSSSELPAMMPECTDSPLIVQLAGDCASTLVEATRLLHEQNINGGSNVAAIDLNLGCPQNIAKRGNYGAYLLPDKELVKRLLSSMVKSTEGMGVEAMPITAKIRRLDSEDDTIELARAIEGCGVSMLTVHGRTVEERKMQVGTADWDILRRIKSAVCIPIVANGGVRSRSDACACLVHTGCDAVMSSEGLLENPKLFNETSETNLLNDYLDAQLSTAEEYLALLHAYPLPNSAPQVARSHIFKILYRFLNGSRNWDVRDRLGLASLEEIVCLISELRDRVEGLRLGAESGVAEELAIKNNFLGQTSWYMRHRNTQRNMHVSSNDTTPLMKQQALKEILLKKRQARLGNEN